MLEEGIGVGDGGGNYGGGEGGDKIMPKCYSALPEKNGANTKEGWQKKKGEIFGTFPRGHKPVGVKCWERFTDD